MHSSIKITDESVIEKIYLIRGKKIMLDRDLAELYGVPTRVLNQAIKRNFKRFPPDFRFKRTSEELEHWKSQIVTSNSNKEKMGLRKLPNVFTEQGVAMLSSALNSDAAIEVNIQIIRIFSRIREVLLTNKDILLKLEQVEREVGKHTDEIQIIFNALRRLLDPPLEPRKRIGYGVSNEE